MNQRRASIYNRCPNCRIHTNLCVCEHIHPFKIQTNISLVVHVRELILTSNTAQFVQKMLPQNAQVFVRGQINNPFDSAPIIEREGRPLFLYPHDDAIEVNEDFKSKYPGPYHIIIPDGNWHQARRVRKREVNFKNIPAIKLPTGTLGAYKLREAAHPEWLSTYEAVAYALGILESKSIEKNLMSFFHIWVQHTLDSRAGKASDTLKL